MACNKDEAVRAKGIAEFSNGQVHEIQNNAHPAFPAQSVPTPSPPFSDSNGPSRNPMTSISCFFRRDTFWTLCNRCNVLYEYTSIFLNQTLLCYRCHQPYLAAAIPVQSRSSRSRPFPNQQQQDKHAAAQPSASRTSQAPSAWHTTKRGQPKGDVKMAESVMITMKEAKG